MDEIFNITSLEWQPIRPDITHGVYGKSLLTEGIKLTLTRVSAGGKFDKHQDKYGHLFYFLSGEGIVQIQDKQYKITPGLVVKIAAGELHSYENTSDIDLMLISVNMPTS